MPAPSPNPLYVDSRTLMGLSAYADTRTATNRTAKTLRQGQQRSRQKGHGLEFHQARPYIVGDDVRRIDWRISARKNKLHSRELQQDHETALFIAIDQTWRMRFASTGYLKSVQGAMLAALLGFQALSAQNPVGGWIHANVDGSNAPMLKPTLAKKKFHHWLGALAHANYALTATDTPYLPHWNNTLPHLLRLVPRGAHLIIIGDAFSITDADLAYIRYRKSLAVSVIHISDVLETTALNAPNITLTDGVNTALPNGRMQRITEAWAARLVELHRYGFRGYRLDTATPVLDFFNAF